MRDMYMHNMIPPDVIRADFKGYHTKRRYVGLVHVVQPREIGSLNKWRLTLVKRGSDIDLKALGKIVLPSTL